MLPNLAAGLLAARADTGPPVTELVPIRIHGTDSTWPPVLVFFALVVVVGGLFVAMVFLRRAREATRPARRPIDGRPLDG
jgi:hypothetical protein